MSHLYEGGCNIKVNDGTPTVKVALNLSLNTIITEGQKCVKTFFKNYECYKNSLRIKFVRADSLGFAHKCM